MKKIAVTGVKARERIILTQALSYLTGYDIVRPTAYSIKALKFNLKKDIRHCSWQELFTYTISSFTERIELDQNYKQFISNGSVFDELAHLEAIYDLYILGDEKKQEYAYMNESIKRIITEYATRQYDCIVHIHNPEAINDPFYKKMEDNLKAMTQICDNRIYIKDEILIGDTLNGILSDNNITPLISSETALLKAKHDINQSIDS